MEKLRVTGIQLAHSRNILKYEAYAKSKVCLTPSLSFSTKLPRLSKEES